MTNPPPPLADADPKIGLEIQNRYRIVRKIGDGGMGAVYEGLHLIIKRRVAIKVLHPQFAKNPEIVARFHREAEAATSIGHPNIVEVTDMGTLDDGSAYMVLEFLDGRDWSDDIGNEGPQPLGKVAQILSQCCDALEAAHAKGIVHRDLKPENIFLIARSGNPNFVKVVDFGISKIMDGADSPGHSLTQTGTALGTPYYMAPEQCQGKKDIDHRADIYSLGVILFQSLTAQYPFDDESYPMLVLKICTEQPPLLSTFRPDLPLQMQGVLQSMLAKNRDNRFGSVAELRAALAPYLEHNEAPVLAADAPSTASRGPSVLHGPPVSTPVSAPGAFTPVSSPTGTAYLPSTPGIGPGTTPYPLQVPRSSNRGLLLAVAAMLGLLVAGGVGVGTWMGMRGGDPDPGPTIGSTNTPPSGPSDSVEDDDSVADGSDDDSTDDSNDPSVAQDSDMVFVVITAPEGVTIEIEGENLGNRYEGSLARGEHVVEARGEGYNDFSETVSFRRGRTYTVSMVPVEPEVQDPEPAVATRTRTRVRTRRDDPIVTRRLDNGSGGGGGRGTNRPAGTTTRGGGTIGSGVVFGH